MSELPTGTVTFLFTDLEGSTRLWEEHPEAMKDALARHDAILNEAIAAHEGHRVKGTGDGVHAVFASPLGAVRAAADAQVDLARESWSGVDALRVRMSIHTGVAEQRDRDYYGPALNRAARLMSVAHGGQVLVSLATKELLDGMAGDAGFVDLGEHRLRDLGVPMRVYQLSHPDLPSDFPALRSLDVLPGNLPRQTTTFVGREREIAALADLVRQRLLVTLTGVGGVGKTRLAIQAAAELAPEFPDGVWLCELASVKDPDAVWETLAASIGVHPSPGRSLEDLVIEYLGSKRLLLILDNCEHLLDATARVADLIGKRSDRVVVLATSREGLAVAGEQIVAVRSLELPDVEASVELLAHVDAVCLFVDRAQDAKSDFVLTHDNASAVAELCCRLDGIPLAIELAAARAGSLVPEDLVARLDQRFKLLTHGSRAALERQQTLRNTIDWSYDLLSDAEREALNRMSVFAGGADLGAAEAVVAGSALEAADVADLLSQLVNKSLVVVDDHNGPVRYRLFETIRQYAQERLDAVGDPMELRRRHADHYVRRAEAAGPLLRSREQITTASHVWRDADNFRAALDWAVEASSPDHALRIAAPLAVFGTQIGYASFGWAESAAEIPSASIHPLFPAVASWAALGVASRGNLARANDLDARVQDAEGALGTHQLQPCLTRATLGFFRGDLEQARRDAEAAVTIARSSREPYEVAQALTILGVATGFADPDSAAATIGEAVQIARAAGIASVLSTSLTALAMVLPIEDASRALELYDEAVEVGTRIGDRLAVLTSSAAKAVLAARSGDWRSALQASADAAEQSLGFGDVHTLMPAYAAAAVALTRVGHLEPAAVLIGAADVGGRRPAPDWGTELLAATDAALLAGLGSERVALFHARGAAFDPAEAVAYLRSEADRVLAEPSKDDAP